MGLRGPLCLQHARLLAGQSTSVSESAEAQAGRRSVSGALEGVPASQPAREQERASERGWRAYLEGVHGEHTHMLHDAGTTASDHVVAEATSPIPFFPLELFFELLCDGIDVHGVSRPRLCTFVFR